MYIRTKWHRAWYGRRRCRWYLYSPSGRVICWGARSYADEQLAWEEARYAFGEGVTLWYDAPDPDESLELYAGPRDFGD